MPSWETVRKRYATALSKRSVSGSTRVSTCVRSADQRFGRGRDGEGAVSEPDHQAADRAAFGVVGVEQRLLGQPSGDQGELPAQVPGFLDAGVHALRAGWAVDVGGVAGQEDAAKCFLGVHAAWLSSSSAMGC